jgi:ribokinase
MATREGRDSPDAVVLAHTLEKLRARDGVVASRLGEANRIAAPLLNVPAIRNRLDGTVDPAEVALEVVSLAVANSPDVTHRIVADAVLGLGALAGVYLHRHVDDRVVAALRADSLGKRRAAVLGNWRRLHEALGVIPIEPPSDRTLRGTIEPEVLAALARRLLALDADRPTTTLRPADPEQSETQYSGRAVVVGAAVMDAIFRTRVIPQHETSTLAHGFALSPGGKGLSQAVALSRLGLDVSLIAAVGDDSFGREILAHLREQGVDTSLVKTVPGARTPVTGVFELPLGDSIAAVWRNEQEIRLTVRDVDQWAGALADCDAVLATFEVPRETLQRTLSLARSPRGRNPVVIVTAGQPYPDGGIARQSLSQIDYLVAHAWELENLAPSHDERFDPDRVSDYLLARGVENVCLLGNGGGTIYSHHESHPRRLPTVWSHFKESSITRDAFCAALATMLIERGAFTTAVAKWVTAAMACAAEDFSHQTTMPDRARIEQKLRQERRPKAADPSGRRPHSTAPGDRAFGEGRT